MKGCTSQCKAAILPSLCVPLLIRPTLAANARILQAAVSPLELPSSAPHFQVVLLPARDWPARSRTRHAMLVPELESDELICADASCGSADHAELLGKASSKVTAGQELACDSPIATLARPSPDVRCGAVLRCA
ncbi:uncharacterized protein LY89DRAFT_670960 [Mollisia scopiformis]|uniref:Uncharacterized protein n=1 Tax=Mollisia scopiformis TaxID=149040 RepID=A0A194X5P4_MOLSC|nr:uncharacterized protein LY89DRAFT_670960 [Mollisia scopiformis]KUJ15498.1 hypothetical protein LY89DRAFT_670960 [Mollisia scopiformis]